MADYTDIVEKWVFVTGHVLDIDRFAFLAHYHPALREEVYLACVFVLDEHSEWVRSAPLQWQGVGLTLEEAPDRAIVVLGRDGETVTITGAGEEQGQIIDPERTVGPLRGIQCIGGATFAYGMRRQIYRRIAQREWQNWDKGLPREASDPGLTVSERIRLITREMGGINALTGRSPGELYAVGTRGEIWLNDGATWEAVDSPTNSMLRDACIGEDGTVYACGQVGTILRGRMGAWELVEYSGTEGLDFVSVVWFAGRLFLADGYSVRVLDHGKLSTVDFGVKETVPAHQLHTRAGVMLSVAGKEIYSTKDGEQWTPIIG